LRPKIGISKEFINDIYVKKIKKHDPIFSMSLDGCDKI
jgi:hypothetical protein